MATNISKATIRNEVLLLTGWSSSGSSMKLTNAEINSLLEADHLEIMGLFEWHQEERDIAIATVAMTNGTGATVNNGSTLVVSTDAANGWVSQFLRVGTENDLYQVSSVNAGSNATLEIAYQGTNDAAANISVFPLYYSVANDALFVTDVVGNEGPLDERTRDYFDDIDPGRTQAANMPTDWAHVAFPDSNGGLQIELFPHDNVTTPLRVHYVRAPSITTDTDTVIYPSELLKWKTAESACLAMAGRTSDPMWSNLAQTYQTRFQLAFRSAVRQEIPHLKERQSMRSRRSFSDRNRERPWR